MSKETFVIPWGSVRLRSIEEGDLERLRVWRNENRRWFGSTAEIAPEMQRAWFSSYCERANDHQFMIESDNRPLGTVALYSIDEPTGEAEFGRLIVDHGARKLGYAFAAASVLMRWAWETFDPLLRIRLYVKSENRAALRLYDRIGFNVVGTAADGLIRMEKFPC